jgi:murein DD-endopeptidase MepM/ murein hydrolase activator NlpD
MAQTKNTYFMPVKKKDLKLVISDPRAHNDFLQYAIDFILPEGTEIISACDGKVVDVKTDSNEGGLDKKYMGNKFLNYITIEHDNKELSQYAHLKQEGSCVKVGQKVKAGQLIGYSGNTGFTSAPHLHFHVCIINDSEIGWETLDIQFNEPLEIIRTESDLSKDDRKLLQEMSK